MKCHATCQKYLDAKEDYSRVKEVKRKDVCSPLHEYKVESMRKYAKRRGR